MTPLHDANVRGLRIAQRYGRCKDVRKIKEIHNEN